ncbi:transcription termination factor NusA [Candidatus Microgenomates bacterium]|nr:transcription termination factor NusA [Candidatus Microgenomates bacterium]
MPQLPRSEFAQAITALSSERGIPVETIIEQLKTAMIAAYKREIREQEMQQGIVHEPEDNSAENMSDESEEEQENLTAEFNEITGGVRIFKTEDGKKEDITPPGFSRIAAQAFRQIFRQKTREAEKEAILGQYEGKVGQLVSGVVLRFEGQDARVDLGKAEAVLPASERIAGERLSPSQRLTFLLKDITEGARGRELILTRADTEFVKKLFAREVPEIGANSVEIRLIARDAGVRTKIAVASKASGVDPVGSCVGQKGVRVQAVINELDGEKIDVIPWTDDVVQLVTSALAPAQNVAVTVDKESGRAVARVPQDQLSLAIGKDGQNVRLASSLAGLIIDIEGSGQASDESEEKMEIAPEPEKLKEPEKQKEIEAPVAEEALPSGEPENSENSETGKPEKSDKSENTDEDGKI